MNDIVQMSRYSRSDSSSQSQGIDIGTVIQHGPVTGMTVYIASMFKGTDHIVTLLSLCP